MITLYKILYWVSILGFGLGLFIVTNYSTTYQLIIGIVILTFSLLAVIDIKIWIYYFNKEKQKETLYGTD